jgi:hypothetical protein
VSDLGGVDFVATGDDLLRLKFKQNELAKLFLSYGINPSLTFGSYNGEVAFYLNLDGKPTVEHEKREPLHNIHLSPVVDWINTPQYMSRVKLSFAIRADATPEKRAALLRKYSLEEKDLDLLEKCDPTPNARYLDWLCRRFDELILPQDTKIMRDALDSFDQIKDKPKFNHSKNLDSYKTKGELFKALESYENTGITTDSTEQQKREKKSNAKVVYKDGQMTWYKCVTGSQAVVLGSGTKWCTTQLGTANEYVGQNPIYICYVEGKPVLQLHLGKHLQIMNPLDELAVRGICFMLADLKEPFCTSDSKLKEAIEILKDVEHLPIFLEPIEEYAVKRRGEVPYPSVDQWKKIYDLLPQNLHMVGKFNIACGRGEVPEEAVPVGGFSDELLEVLVADYEKREDYEGVVHLLVDDYNEGERSLWERFTKDQQSRLMGLIYADCYATLLYSINLDQEIPRDMKWPIKQYAIQTVNDYTKKYKALQNVAPVNEDGGPPWDNEYRYAYGYIMDLPAFFNVEMNEDQKMAKLAKFGLDDPEFADACFQGMV